MVAVLIGAPEPLSIGKTVRDSGIRKVAAAGAVAVGRHGVAGDHVLDTENHGGVDQAVYVYFQEHTAWWSRQLGRSLPPGAFGENLLLHGFGDLDLHIGDRLEVGEVVLEVTAPRIPCATLSTFIGSADFVKRFRAAERPGFYTRVVREGEVAAMDAARHIPDDDATVGLIELYRTFFSPDVPRVQAALAAPIAARMRARLQTWLAEQ